MSSGNQQLLSFGRQKSPIADHCVEGGRSLLIEISRVVLCNKNTGKGAVSCVHDAGPALNAILPSKTLLINGSGRVSDHETHILWVS